MSSTIETFHLGPFVVPRVWVGLWQLSSNAWGSVSVTKVRAAMQRHVDNGYTTFADHYGGAELIFGQFRYKLPSPTSVIGATKWCVFKNIIPTRGVVRAVVLDRMERMRSNQVDLLQFHWQDYSDKNYLPALCYLLELQDEGLIASIGLCNFDTIRTDEICTQLGRGAIVSNQVQFSIIDTRPLHGMTDVCEKHGVKLLTYGTLCGGFLSDKWLGKPEPDPYSSVDKLTPSQRKYLDIILKGWGTWELFQDLLVVLRRIADRHKRSIANIATRWVLDHRCVGAVIIGARLGISDNHDDNHLAFGFHLTAQDREDIQVILKKSNSCTLITSIGDCGAEYRSTS